MLFRNLASMDVEESIRGNPVDGVVLLVGCDKTTPACVMGAASCDLPTLVLSGGPMLNGKFRGEDIGSGTHVWRFSEDVRRGIMSPCDFQEAEGCMSRSAGHCMTMGTASTMACLVEALGIALPTNAAIPAVDSRRYALAHQAGRRIVEMVHEDLRMSRILTRKAFENAVRAVNAVGGSTNAVIHLLAIAGRIGVDLSLDDWDALGRDVPCLVDLMPAGRYLMEDFYYAGGLPAVLRELGDRIHGDALTVSGKTVGENVADAPCYNRERDPAAFEPRGGGRRHRRAPRQPLPGRSDREAGGREPAPPEAHGQRPWSSRTIEDFHARIDDPDLEVDEGSVLVLKNCGPRGYPGMPEVGNMPLPPKLLKKGVTDMIRISDARMSGTAYGTVVLHVAPEAAAGGVLGLVRSGDLVELDVGARRLQLLVADDELAARRGERRDPAPESTRGYARLYIDHVMQANLGRGLRLPGGRKRGAVARESH